MAHFWYYFLVDKLIKVFYTIKFVVKTPFISDICLVQVTFYFFYILLFLYCLQNANLLKVNKI